MSEDINSKIYKAAGDGKYEEVLTLTANKTINPKWRQGQGKSALHNAADRGHVRIAMLLLDKGWDLEQRDDKSWTPIHCAADCGHVDMIVCLAARGADIDSPDENQWTPLHDAAWRDHRDAINILLSIGADRNFKNKDGKSPDCVSENAETKAIFDKFSEQDQFQLLARAVREDDFTSAALLVERGSNRWKMLDSIQDENRREKILQQAVSLGSSETEKAFIASCASLEDKNEDGNTLLHLAVRNSLKGIVKILIAKGSHVEAMNNEHNTPLHIAVEKSNKSIVAVLLSNGASVYSSNKKGISPLDIAAANNDEESLKILLVELMAFALKNEKLLYTKDFQDKLLRIIFSKLFEENQKCLLEYIVDRGSSMIEQREQIIRLLIKIDKFKNKDDLKNSEYRVKEQIKYYLGTLSNFGKHTAVF